MAITITCNCHSYERENYEVNFFDREIDVVVTHLSMHVRKWINPLNNSIPLCRTCRLCGRLRRLIVGLDVEWRPNFNRQQRGRNPVALLQLCVGGKCLVFQLRHADKIPQCLVDFLQDDDLVFVGVGIDDDVQKLMEDYDLGVGNTFDLRQLASTRLGRPELRNVGLVALAREVLGIEYDKPRAVTISNWDAPYLSKPQVQYASIDAFLSFSIARKLRRCKCQLSGR